MEQLGWRLVVGRAVTGPWPAPPCPASPWDWGQPVRALPTHLAVPKPLLPEPPNVPANSHWPRGGLRLPRDAPGRLRWSEQGGLQGNGLRGTSNPQWGPSGPSEETTERCTQHPSAPPCGAREAEEEAEIRTRAAMPPLCPTRRGRVGRAQRAEPRDPQSGGGLRLCPAPRTSLTRPHRTSAQRLQSEPALKGTINFPVTTKLGGPALSPTCDLPKPPGSEGGP